MDGCFAEYAKEQMSQAWIFALVALVVGMERRMMSGGRAKIVSTLREIPAHLCTYLFLNTNDFAKNIERIYLCLTLISTLFLVIY